MLENAFRKMAALTRIVFQRFSFGVFLSVNNEIFLKQIGKNLCYESF